MAKTTSKYKKLPVILPSNKIYDLTALGCLKGEDTQAVSSELKQPLDMSRCVLPAYNSFNEDKQINLFKCVICGCDVEFLINGMCEGCRYEDNKFKHNYRSDDRIKEFYEKQKTNYLDKYEEKHILSIKRLEECMVKILVYEDRFNSSGEIYTKHYLCHNNFCTHEKCINLRIEKALNTLNEIGIQKNKYEKECMAPHFGLGSLFRNKDKLLIVKNKLLRKIKNKYGYPNKELPQIFNKKLNIYEYQKDFIYISVFDIGKNNYKKNKEKYFNHLHLAIFGINNIVIKHKKEFLKDCQEWLKEIDPLCVFKHFDTDENGKYEPLKKKEKLFEYFAKRMAGVFGHKKTGFYYYKDMMSKKEYLENYFCKRILTYHLAVGLHYKSISNVTETCCKCHLEPLTKVDEYELNHKGEPPPEYAHKKLMKKENLIIRKTTTTTIIKKLKKGFEIIKFSKMDNPKTEIEWLKFGVKRK